jgi:ribosomal protein L40E
MNDLICQACGATAPANAHHCENCGGADWRPPTDSAPVATDASDDPQPSPDSAPVASETTTRSKRNR